MAHPECTSLGIPDRLHRNGQAPNNDFSSPEVCYRRYPFLDLIKSKREYPLSVYSVALSFKGGMSINRGRYSPQPSDVLFNTKSNSHFDSDYGVVQLRIEGVIAWSTSQRDDETRNYTLEIVHEPETCMYPHSAIYLLKDGSRTDGPSGGGLKMQIKRQIAAASLIEDLGKLSLPTN